MVFLSPLRESEKIIVLSRPPQRFSNNPTVACCLKSSKGSALGNGQWLWKRKRKDGRQMNCCMTRYIWNNVTQILRVMAAVSKTYSTFLFFFFFLLRFAWQSSTSNYSTIVGVSSFYQHLSSHTFQQKSHYLRFAMDCSLVQIKLYRLNNPDVYMTFYWSNIVKSALPINRRSDAGLIDRLLFRYAPAWNEEHSLPCWFLLRKTTHIPRVMHEKIRAHNSSSILEMFLIGCWGGSQRGRTWPRK